MLDFLVATCKYADLGQIAGFLKVVYTIIEIAIPVLLILFGTIDLGKAVMAGEEKEIKAATEMLMKRVIAAIAVFLLVVVVRLVTSIVGGDDWKACWDTTFDKTQLSSAPIVEQINI